MKNQNTQTHSMQMQELYAELKKVYGECVSLDDDGIMGYTEDGWYTIHTDEDGKLRGDHENSKHQNWMYDCEPDAQAFIDTIAEIHYDELNN